MEFDSFAGAAPRTQADTYLLLPVLKDVTKDTENSQMNRYTGPEWEGLQPRVGVCAGQPGRSPNLVVGVFVGSLAPVFGLSPCSGEREAGLTTPRF